MLYNNPLIRPAISWGVGTWHRGGNFRPFHSHDIHPTYSLELPIISIACIPSSPRASQKMNQRQYDKNYGYKTCVFCLVSIICEYKTMRTNANTKMTQSVKDCDNSLALYCNCTTKYQELGPLKRCSRTPMNL